MAAALLEGASIGPLIGLAIEIDSRYAMNSLFIPSFGVVNSSYYSFDRSFVICSSGYSVSVIGWGCFC